MGTIVTFFPNGEYLQGHIPKRRDDRRVRLVDSSPVGREISLREQISANTEPPRNPAAAEIEPWERRGTKFFGRNATIWEMWECRWDGYTFLVRQYGGGTSKKSISGRGVRRLLLEGLEPFDTEYNNIFNITTDTYVNASDALAAFGSDLGSSSVDILDTHRNRKKCESLTKYMARGIRNGCYLMEQRHGVENLSFLTLTVPSLSPDGYDAVCHSWGILVNRFTKWLRRETEKRENYEQEYVYCTEIQEKRRKRAGVVAPHLHMVFRGRGGRRSPWTFTPSEIRAKWAELLKSCVGVPFETRALENLQQVKKSAGGYLAKYLGKGVSSEDLPELRTHWGGMSRNLCRLIRSCCTVWRSDGSGSEYIHRFLGAQERLVNAALVKSFKRFWVDLEDGVKVCDPRDGREYRGIGFWVGSGVLSTSTYCGGVVKVVAYLERVSECSL